MKNLIVILAFMVYGCTSLRNLFHDEQFIQIQLAHAGTYIDTFNGELHKNLLPGDATTSFWFTKDEQELILAKVDSINFFSIPDTIKEDPNPSTIISPNLSPYWLRIRIGNRDKKIIRYSPPLKEYYEYGRLLSQLEYFILKIACSKKEYLDLPPTIGGYQ